jgi:uncharacterized protein (DUF736 family)
MHRPFSPTFRLLAAAPLQNGLSRTLTQAAIRAVVMFGYEGIPLRLRRNTMSVIGYLIRKKNGTYHGVLNTLAMNAPVILVPVSKTSDTAPDYRILSGRAEVGAAWIRTTETSGFAAVALMIDTPELPRRIHASLHAVQSQEDTGFYTVVWIRPGMAR